MTAIRKYLLRFALIAFFPFPAMAWGVAGHEVVCEIAFQRLNASARSKLIALSQQEPKSWYRLYRRSCAWADRLPGRLRREEHYMNVPRDWQSIRQTGCPQAERCILRAIEDDVARIADPVVPPLQRWQALKFLGHWVADIHQPFHVSFADDLGGNRIRLARQLDCAKNLHAYWDRCLVNSIMQKHSAETPAELAQRLLAGLEPAQEAQWLQQSEPWQWANESLQLVRQPAIGYCQLQEGRCASIAGLSADADRTMELLDDTYRQQFVPVAAQRLTQAGVRLGALLNRVLSAP